MEEAEVRSAARQMIWLHGSRAKDQAGERADKSERHPKAA
jgi:hypothetical protein